MAFDYDGVSLPDDGTTVSRVVRGSRLLIVNRDPEAEQVLLDSLPQALLRLDELTAHAGLPPPQENPRLLLLNLEDDLPASIEVWPEMLATPVQWWSMIDRLRRAGVCIEFESDFPPEPQRLIPDDWYADLEPDGNGWFDLGLDVEVNGERIDLLPILRTLLADEAFPFEPAVDEPEDASLEVVLDEERVLVLPLARLRPLVKPIFDWLDGGGDSIRLPVTAAARLDMPSAQWTGRGPAEIRKLARLLAELPPAVVSHTVSPLISQTISSGQAANFSV